MPLGQYPGAGAGITKALYRLRDLTDESGNSNTLTNTGSVTFTSGRFGDGANLGTSNSTKYLAVAVDGGITTNITMSGWARVLTSPGVGAIGVWFYQSYLANKINRYIGYQNVGGVLQLVFQHGRMGVVGDIQTYNITLDGTKFYHVALTDDGTTLIGYLNGEKIVSAAVSASAGTSGVSNITVGRNANNGIGFASIIAGEFILENRIWTPADVKKYYTFAEGIFALG